MTMVREESMVVDTSLMAKSLETRGMSLTPRMPFISPAAAVRKASLTSSASVFFSTCTTRSTTDTFGVGTRSAMPARSHSPRAHHRQQHSERGVHLLHATTRLQAQSNMLTG